MSRGQWRYAALEHNTLEIEQFCRKYKFELTRLNNGYQLRIEDTLDVYPVRQRWHWLPDGTRGHWRDTNDLRRILLAKLPDRSTAYITNSPPQPIPPPKKSWWRFW
jgi:hypothetical protein